MVTYRVYTLAPRSPHHPRRVIRIYRVQAQDAESAKEAVWEELRAREQSPMGWEVLAAAVFHAEGAVIYDGCILKTEEELKKWRSDKAAIELQARLPTGAPRPSVWPSSRRATR